MSEKRIMLLGAQGQVGQALRASAPSDWVIGAYGRQKLDITQHHKVQSAIHEFRPGVIINAAALTAVDEAEKNSDLAMAVNFNAVANLAAHASAGDIPIIHLSTDYVFDGEDGHIAYKPDDRLHPVNVYGESKLMGEEALRHGHAWHVILRISSVFSAYGHNILTSMLTMMDERDEILGFTDMTTGPTAATEVAAALITIAEQLIKGKPDGFGVFHLSGSPPATRFEFADAVFAAYGPHAKKTPRLLPALSKEIIGRALRPSWTVFDCEKIEKIYGIKQKPWRDSLIEAVKTHLSRREVVL